MNNTIPTFYLASTLAIAAPELPPFGPTWTCGKDAEFVAQCVKKFNNCEDRTMSYKFDSRKRILEALGLLEYDENAAASHVSMALANEFAGLLPNTARIAEVCVDAEGDVAFEWDIKEDRYCIVSFSSDGRLICGAMRAGDSRRTFSTLHKLEAIQEIAGYINV